MKFSILFACAILVTISQTDLLADPPPSRKTAEVLAVEKARGAVVNILSERTAQVPSHEELYAVTPSHRGNGMGTGVILDPRGYIVTNHHVVEDVNVIRVRLNDKSSHLARVMARDRENDLALLKIETTQKLPVIQIGTSSDIMVGERVIAIGNAYGYEHTVSIGVVSAINRDVSLNREISYKSLIQTDACINPGNSGGPLLNIHGDLIGLNVAIRAGAQGIGFAIPADQVVSVTTGMLAKLRRADVGVGMVCRHILINEPGSDRMLRQLQLEKVEPTGPAAKAGLQAGDLILQVGNTPVTSTLDLERAILEARPNETFPVRLRRGARDEAADLVLAPVPSRTTDLAMQKLGIQIATIAPETVTRAQPTLRGGMLIRAVEGNSLASRAGIQPGDILVGLHQWETATNENVNFVLGHPSLSSFYPLRFYVVREGQLHRGWFPAE
jgi:serine protease Do